MEDKITLMFMIVLCICFIGLIISTIGLIVCKIQIKNLNNRTKYKPYQDKVWACFVENAGKFKFVEKIEYKPNDWAYVWKYGHYVINVWISDRNKPAHTSVHTDGYYFDGNRISTAGECVLCGFNYYRSKELARLLMMRYYKEKLYLAK